MARSPVISPGVAALERKDFETWLRGSKASASSKKRMDRAWRSGRSAPSNERSSVSVTPKPTRSSKSASKTSTPVPSEKATPTSKPVRPAKPTPEQREKARKATYSLSKKKLDLPYTDFKEYVDRQPDQKTRKRYWRDWRKRRSDLLATEGHNPEYRVVMRIYAKDHGVPIGSEGFIYASFTTEGKFFMSKKRLWEEARYATREYDLEITKVEVATSYSEWDSERIGWG